MSAPVFRARALTKTYGVGEAAMPLGAPLLEVADARSLEAVVEDGLKPGERVIVYPSDALRDGSRTEIPVGGR